MMVVVHMLSMIDWAFPYQVTHLPTTPMADGCTNDGPSPPLAQLPWSHLLSHRDCRVIVSITFDRVLECGWVCLDKCLVAKVNMHDMGT